LLLPLGLTTALFAFFFSEDLLYQLYDVYRNGSRDIEQLRYSGKVFSFILTTFLPMSMIFVFSTLLTAKADLKMLNIFALITLIANLLLNFILIPLHGSLGASISALITQSIFALLC